MLKQRLLTAAILIPIVVWGIMSLGNFHFSLLLGLFLLIGAWEWTRFAGIKQSIFRISYALLIALLLVLSWWLWANKAIDAITLILASALPWWIIGLIWVIRYPASELAGNTYIKLLLGLWVLVPPWLALVVLHGDERFGPVHVLSFLVLIWLADSGAYFSGRRWGKRKLASKVSPGKTLEGVWGALAVSTLWALLIGHYLEVSQAILFVILCVMVVLISILGDLLESMLKRQVGIKDSGTIFPGHGGVLDRIDSLTAAAPLFVLGLILLESLV